MLTPMGGPLILGDFLALALRALYPIKLVSAFILVDRHTVDHPRSLIVRRIMKEDRILSFFYALATITACGLTGTRSLLNLVDRVLRIATLVVFTDLFDDLGRKRSDGNLIHRKPLT
jgi:hypothetical protein